MSNDGDDGGGAGQPRSDILGRLLVMQQTLDVMSDERGVALYLCSALRQVPGVSEVHLCYRGAPVSPEPEDSPCRRCRDHPDWDGMRPCRLEGLPGYTVMALRTHRALYGHLVFASGDRKAFGPYEPYLANFANVVATLFENHELLRETREANRRLAEARDALEEKVAERTASLTLLNHRLEREVRERKAAEERANTFALYARGVIEACPDPIIIFTGDGRISDVNEAAERATGQTRYQLVGTHFPGCFAAPDAARALCLKVFADGAVRDRQLSLAHATGRLRDVLFNAAVYRGESGQVAGAVAVVRDVTDRVRAERELAHHRRVLQTLIDSTEDSIALIDADGRVRACNQALAALFGTEPERLAGIVLDDLFPPAEAAARRAAIGRAIEQGQPVREEVRWHDRVLETNIYPVPDRDGHVTAVTVQSRDITDQKRHEVELEKARVAAEQASDAKSSFLASMSHELRTPLNAILGFSEILRDQMYGPLGHEKYLEYARDIHGSGEHLLELIKDILDISKIEAGRMEVEPRMVEVAAVIRDATRLMTEPADLRELDLRVDLPDPALRVWVDDRALRQILLNLLSNAVKFTPPGGRVTVSARAVDLEESGGWGGVEIAVSDTGIGIPADQISRVLQPFERIDNRYSRAAGGTGLGLALVRGLVELHRGRVAIDSRVGLGTTVAVWFPSRP